MSNLIGQTLGPYRIIEQIGIGGMATVYKAYQPSMDRYVAIKVLPAVLSRDPAFLKRFQRETKVVAKLEHKHILPVYDYGEQEGLTYLVMRYVEAGTLNDRLAAGQLDLSEIYRIMAQVGAALDYAHWLGVIHRDVKPSNVLIDSQGDAYLTDFGLARIMESSEQFTATGVGVGTPAYMAPEQGQGLKVDHRSDVYSLGVMLYEMVTGQVPYQAETPMAVVIKHIIEPLPLPRQIAPDLPEEVERVILKALAKSPDDRFQMVREMVETLDLAVRAATAAAPAAAWVEGEVAPPAAAARKLHWPWDARTTALCVGITALALLVIGGMFFVLSRIQYRVQVVGGRVEVVPISTETVTPTPAVALVETPTSEAMLAATATPQPTTAPTVEYTPTPTPAPTWTPTPTRVPTPLAETIAQPATEMDSGSPKTLLFDSFDDSAYERGYNTRLWSCNNCEVGSISREDGAIRLELSGTDLALNLSSRSSWPSSQVRYIKGRLKLIKDKNNGNGTVDLSFHTTLASKYWQTGCLITPSQFSLTQAEYGCEIFTVDAQKQWRYEYRTPTTVVAYEEWHTTKIELMPNTFELRFYLDDKLIGQHTPIDVDELKSRDLTAQIGIYTYGGKYSHVVSYADDVSVVPAP